MPRFSDVPPADGSRNSQLIVSAPAGGDRSEDQLVERPEQPDMLASGPVAEHGRASCIERGWVLNVERNPYRKPGMPPDLLPSRTGHSAVCVFVEAWKLGTGGVTVCVAILDTGAR